MINIIITKVSGFYSKTMGGLDMINIIITKVSGFYSKTMGDLHD